MSETLSLLRGLARQRNEKADQIRTVVAEARGEGKSWQAIGDALGVSRQAAAQMYGVPRAGKAER